MRRLIFVFPAPADIVKKGRGVDDVFQFVEILSVKGQRVGLSLLQDRNVGDPGNIQEMVNVMATVDSLLLVEADFLQF